MMLLTHTLVGGVIGENISNPYLAFIIGLISHLIFDKIPHFWPKSEKMGDIFTYLDGFLSLFAMFLFWLFGFHEISFWAGVLGSIIVDLAAKGSGLIKKENFYYIWQRDRQPHFFQKTSLISDTIFIISCVVILTVNR